MSDPDPLTKGPVPKQHYGWTLCCNCSKRGALTCQGEGWLCTTRCPCPCAPGPRPSSTGVWPTCPSTHPSSTNRRTKVGMSTRAHCRHHYTYSADTSLCAPYKLIKYLHTSTCHCTVNCRQHLQTEESTYTPYRYTAGSMYMQICIYAYS